MFNLFSYKGRRRKTEEIIDELSLQMLRNRRLFKTGLSLPIYMEGLRTDIGCMAPSLRFRRLNTSIR